MGLCKTLSTLGLLTLVLSGCASELSNNAKREAANPEPIDTASSNPQLKDKTALAGETTEVLLAIPPSKWHQIYQLNEQVVRLADFVPANETTLNWQTKLSFESHSNLVDLDPIEILLSEAKKSEEKCTFIQHFNLFSGFENNYPTSLRLIMCGENENLKQGELNMLKVIQGDDFLYIIRFLKRIEPFKLDQPDVEKSEIATWSDYLRKIRLCNPANDKHPCKA
jgi:hypothetical protein